MSTSLFGFHRCVLASNTDGFLLFRLGTVTYIRCHSIIVESGKTEIM